jgi:hypothetical protein
VVARAGTEKTRNFFFLPFLLFGQKKLPCRCGNKKRLYAFMDALRVGVVFAVFDRCTTGSGCSAFLERGDLDTLADTVVPCL